MVSCYRPLALVSVPLSPLSQLLAVLCARCVSTLSKEMFAWTRGRPGAHEGAEALTQREAHKVRQAPLPPSPEQRAAAGWYPEASPWVRQGADHRVLDSPRGSRTLVWPLAQVLACNQTSVLAEASANPGPLG